MNAATKALKKEIVERIDDLTQKDIKELRDYVVFLEMKNFIPQIDQDQLYFWTKKWQKMEKAADDDKKSGKILGPFKSVNELLKNLKK